MKDFLKGQRVLVTGGTGSFGNKLASLFAAAGADKIIIFSRDEKKQAEMRRRFPDFQYIIGDVRDASSCQGAVRGVDVVFHAAALKHVPVCEEFPLEALKTNCLGTSNLCEAAKRASVQHVVALSTDKAVEPINAMGISKAMLEKIVLASQDEHHPTRFSCVRYGNVLGTRGSILPIWMECVKNKQPLPITDMSMRRFVMNLVDSVRLVARALDSRGGSVFVLKAEQADLPLLMRAFANVVGCPEMGKMMGIRPGEKLVEVLVCQEELYRTIDHGEFVQVCSTEQPVAERCASQYDSLSAPEVSLEKLEAMLRLALDDMEASL